MYSKSLLIAIAAFAVTATGVHAYGGSKILGRAGLSDDQVEAIEEARELRMMGDFTGARNKLAEAGITEETLQKVHRVTRDARNAVNEALDKGDYKAFLEAIADSPLADIITTEEDFKQFKEAHDLRKAGEWKQSGVIMKDLGVAGGGNDWFKSNHKRHSNLMENFTDDQLEALKIARQSNDRATIQAIYDEAGATKWSKPHFMHQSMN